MLDAFGIARRSPLIDAERTQKLEYDFMAFPTFVGQSLSTGSQCDRLIRRGHDECLCLESLDDPMHGHVGNSESLCEVDKPARPLFTENLRDHLNVILSGFRRMILASALMRCGGSRCISYSRFRFHGY